MSYKKFKSFLFCFLFILAKTVLKLLNLEDLLPDSENYGFSYKELCIKKLLSEVAVTCQTNKSKSHLFESSYFSDNTTALEDQIDNHNCSLRTNIDFPPNSLNNSDILKSKEVAEDLNSFLNSNQNQESKRVSTMNENTVSADNQISNQDEITVLSDLKDMFIDNQTTSGFTLDSTFTTNDETSVSTSPQAKKVALTRPENIESLKKFAFQKFHKNVVHQVTENHQISESTYFNQGPPNINNVSENEEINLFQSSTENDGTSVVMTNENAVKAAAGNHSKNINSELDSETMLNLIAHNIQNDRERGMKTNREMDIISTTKKSNSESGSNVLDSETMLNLIAPTSTSVINPKCNPTHTETTFSDNENPAKANSSRKRKLDSRFQKFLFKGKSKKSESSDSATTDSSGSALSMSNATSREHIDENIKNSTNILSSQRAFKKLFTTSNNREEEFDLDDPFFKI